MQRIMGNCRSHWAVLKKLFNSLKSFRVKSSSWSLGPSRETASLSCDYRSRFRWTAGANGVSPHVFFCSVMFSLWRVAADDWTQRAGTRFDFKVSLVVADEFKGNNKTLWYFPQCNIKSSTEALNWCINLSCISVLQYVLALNANLWFNIIVS